MNFFLFLVIWSVLGGFVVSGLAKLYPDWETWKIITAIILGGPLLWIILFIWFIFIEER